MSSDGSRTSIDHELEEIEAILRALTIRVATLRAASTTAAPVTPPQAAATARAAQARLRDPTAPIPVAAIWTGRQPLAIECPSELAPPPTREP
jgi:hypothetical protein